MSILIVEDNATNALILKHLAKKITDDEIVIEADAIHALELCHSKVFDALILDHMLPGMTGMQLAKAIRMMGTYDGVPIVMVTADQRPDLRAEARSAGVTDFLTKPVEALAFRALLSSYLQRRSQAVAAMV